MFLLPSAPSNWDYDASDVKLHVKHIAKPTFHPIQPIGYEFSALARRARQNRTMYEDMELQAALDELTDDVQDADEEEEEPIELLIRDPKNWKDQDHYQVLGLSAKRWEATEDDIKRAYRRKVLKHHPDKKAASDAATGNSNDDSFFKCIQKAWEILSDKNKRKQWDAVDPTFDETIPKPTAKGNFFDLYNPVFFKSSRFSVHHPVRMLGDIDTLKEEVEAFYHFWYNFQSWRTFEALDEEDVESGSCREEKRWIERKNKAARAKRKKEDNARVTKLVDQAFKLDPRIQKFKDEVKAAKDAKRMEKEKIIQDALDVVRLKSEAEEAEKQKLVTMEKEMREQGKKEKELAKRAIKKEKKAIKTILAPLLEKSGDLQLPAIQKLEAIFDSLTTFADYESFKQTFDGVPSDPKNLYARLEDKNSIVVNEATQPKKPSAIIPSSPTVEPLTEKESLWTPKEVTTLIKAMKLFPSGIADKWQRISTYISDHGGLENETPEHCTARYKSPQSCISLMHSFIPNAGIKMSKKAQGSVARDLLQQEASKVGKKEIIGLGDEATLRDPGQIWSADDQRVLENALKTYPASDFTDRASERWVAIGKAVGKDVKDVKNRIKGLQESIKKKRTTVK